MPCDRAIGVGPGCFVNVDVSGDEWSTVAIDDGGFLCQSRFTCTAIHLVVGKHKDVTKLVHHAVL